VRKVLYSADTKFVTGHSNKNKPGSVDEVKPGNFISCGGTFTGVKLTAKECVTGNLSKFTARLSLTALHLRSPTPN
jgi:hypothetical protein